MQKGQLKQCIQQIRVVGAITFSAKRSLYPHTVDAVGMQYTVVVSAKKSLYPHAVDAVGVGAKRSTDTVYSANKDVGGGHYL